MAGWSPLAWRAYPLGITLAESISPLTTVRRLIVRGRLQVEASPQPRTLELWLGLAGRGGIHREPQPWRDRLWLISGEGPRVLTLEDAVLLSLQLDRDQLLAEARNQHALPRLQGEFAPRTGPGTEEVLGLLLRELEQDLDGGLPPRARSSLELALMTLLIRCWNPEAPGEPGG